MAYHGMRDADSLRKEYGEWGTQADYPRLDWKYEVANDDTTLGYWEWVAAQMEAAHETQP